MSTPWTVFVEGEGDQCFIECLLQHLDVFEVSTAVIGGRVTHLHKIANEIKKSHDAGNLIALLLDANCDFEGRRREFLTQKERLKLPVERFFLLPNDKDRGSLETLLEEMAVPEHRVLFDCFDEYEACRQKAGRYQPPDRKGRIFTYCEALGIETTAPERDYSDSCYWDLTTPALEPLKRFLVSLQAEEGPT